ncbi:MAG: hypothetical protein R3275_11265, partial [Saprospiraceae bacterium]|nr:hypothetical protein [Saprospiraceae bacterium]
RNKNLFFRKGKVGDWKNTLEARLESKFWKKAGAVMLLLGYSREGAVTAFEWTSRKEQKAKKLSRQFRSLSEWFRLFFPDRSRFIRNGHNQKISINPELIYFQAVSTNDPFLELAKSNLSPHQVGLIQLDENKKIKLTTLDENAVDDPAQLKMIISRVSRHYFSMIVEIKDDPIMISGVIDPIEHVVRKYSNLYPDTQVGDLTEVEHFLKFAKEFVNKNAQSRVISKFSRGLQFVWTPENYALKVKALCQRLGWSYKSPHLHDMSIPQSVRRELSGFNRKDLDLYHFFTSKSESHA